MYLKILGPCYSILSVQRSFFKSRDDGFSVTYDRRGEISQIKMCNLKKQALLPELKTYCISYNGL